MSIMKSIILITVILALNMCCVNCSFVKSLGFQKKGDLEHRIVYEIPEQNQTETWTKIITFPGVRKTS